MTPHDLDKPLPGMLALQEATEKQVWPNTIDTRVWVAEWAKHLAQSPELPNDESSMVAWFSNAIMAGYEFAQLMHAQKTKHDVKRLVDGYYKEGPRT